MRKLRVREGLFRDSVAWQKAMLLAKQVYEVSAKFPPEEKFGLTSQVRRAVVSVPSNIAEGKGRTSPGELVLFLGHARDLCWKYKRSWKLHTCWSSRTMKTSTALKIWQMKF